MQHARGATAEFKSTDRFKSIARVLLQQALARRVHRGNGCCLYRPEAAHLLRQAHQRQRRIVAPGIQRAEDAIQERAVINDQLPLLATFRQLADGIQPGAAQTLAVCPHAHRLQHPGTEFTLPRAPFGIVTGAWLPAGSFVELLCGEPAQKNGNGEASAIQFALIGTTTHPTLALSLIHISEPTRPY